MDRKSSKSRSGVEGSTPSAYVDEKGRLCIGGRCVTIKVGDADEVAIEIDAESCTEEEKKALGLLGQKVMQGVPTVYETKRKK